MSHGLSRIGGSRVSLVTGTHRSITDLGEDPIAACPHRSTPRAGALLRQEVRALHEHVVVVALFRIAHAAKGRGPVARPSLLIDEKRTVDEVGRRSAVADEAEVP